MKKFILSVLWLMVLGVPVFADQQSLTAKTTPASSDVFQLYDTDGEPWNITYSNLATSIGAGASGTPGGSSPQLQYNNSGAFGGIAGSSVDSSGNIGIDTASPTASMEIVKSGSIPYFKASDTTIGNGNIFHIGNGGNVAIGTTATTQRLTVYGITDFKLSATPSAPSAVSAGAGSITGTNYKWLMTCYGPQTSQETVPSSASSTLTLSAENATVTLAVCAAVHTVGRRLYRSLGGVAGAAPYYFVKTITDNTTTTTTDSSDDATISINARIGTENTMDGVFYQNGTRIMLAGSTTTAFGRNTGINQTSGSGGVSQSTYFGSDAGRYNTTGINMTAIGQRACSGTGNGGTSSAADYNTCVGFKAGDSINTADRNTLIGTGAGTSLQSGSHNITVGTDSLNTASTANDNNTMGYHAGILLTTATENTIIGGNALDIQASSVDGNFIGYQAGHSTATPSGLSDYGCFGAYCNVGASNSFVIGDIGSSHYYNVGVGTTSPKASFEVSKFNSNIPFEVSSGGANHGNYMLIDTNGNVGIGTGSPNTQSSPAKFTIFNPGASIGWSFQSGANTACNTTCTGHGACVFGEDIGTVGVLNSNLVACTNAAADNCVCSAP